jgi:hypothetical protein
MKKIIILSCVMLLLCSGCAFFKNLTGQQNQPKQQEGLNQAFYGFPDVPIPQELTIVSDKSFVYETSVFKAGVLFFSGNVVFSITLKMIKPAISECRAALFHRM